jgi:serine/threonine protein kinase
MTDNSFKLFAADPTPGHDPRKLIVPSKSTNDLTTTPARDFLAEDEIRNLPHHDRKEDAAPSQAAATTDSKAPATGEKKEVIRGPWRILRLLPRESRHIISRMLDLDPKKRARMDEILQEPWVADTVICQQFDHGEVVPADNHTHTLEPPANQQPEKK